MDVRQKGRVLIFQNIFVATLKSGTMWPGFSFIVASSHTMYRIEINDIIIGRFIHITGVVKMMISRYEYKQVPQ